MIYNNCKKCYNNPENCFIYFYDCVNYGKSCCHACCNCYNCYDKILAYIFEGETHDVIHNEEPIEANSESNEGNIEAVPIEHMSRLDKVETDTTDTTVITDEENHSERSIQEVNAQEV